MLKATPPLPAPAMTLRACGACLSAAAAAPDGWAVSDPPTLWELSATPCDQLPIHPQGYGWLQPEALHEAIHDHLMDVARSLAPAALLIFFESVFGRF